MSHGANRLTVTDSTGSGDPLIVFFASAHSRPLGRDHTADSVEVTRLSSSWQCSLGGDSLGVVIWAISIMVLGTF